MRQTRIFRAQLFVVAILLFAPNGIPQVQKPKHESRLRHLLGAHREADNLPQRFEDIRCALVLIESGPRLGTGFYISSGGDVATASHVIGERKFSRTPNSEVKVEMAVSPMWITNCKGERSQVSGDKVDNNPDAWLADVALIRTGAQTSCWLKEGDDRRCRPGERLIAMGFPGLSFQTLTIYTGIMSARLTTNLPTIILDTGEPVPPPNEFIRVQMPISTGLSGAPIVDDENRAIGIVTNAGAWTRDLDFLRSLFRTGVFQALPAPVPTPQQPNAVGYSINLWALTAELAGLFQDYASPGYGDAVALRYLKKPQQRSQPSASLVH